MARTAPINLTDLLVNTENYRFDTIVSQKEAIDKMVEDQNDKLYNLAVHILENGLNPNDPIQVSPSSHDKKKFNVLEGNRRVITLKILQNPSLIDTPSFEPLKKKFSKLHEGNKGNLLHEVDCTIYDDPSEADKWIKLKHAGQSNGVGTVDWNAQQIQRFEEKVEGKSSIALQTINLLKKSSSVPSEVRNHLGSLPITSLDRLLSDPEIRAFLGVDINNGVIQSEIDESEVLKGLVQIARDLLDPAFKVKRIYTKDDRRDYISKFPKKSTPDSKNKSTGPWLFTKVSGQSPASGTSKPNPHPQDRKHLIPRNCALKISNAKVNSIYYELRKLDISRYTNACAVLLRVFIELSLDCFIEKLKVPKVNIDSKLREKVVESATFLETNGFADKHICKGIRSAVSNRNDLLGVETLNAYVHNPRFAPTPDNLIISWDNVQAFIEKIWENIR
jgi:hypothetical protein